MYDFFQETPANVAYGALPGYGSQIAFAELKDFLILQPTMASPSVEGDTLKISATHTFGSGDGFVKASGYQDGGEMSGESSGDAGFQTPIPYAFKMFLVGDQRALREKVQNMMNRGFIVIINDPECKTVRYLQLGCECDPAIVSKISYTSGNKKSGGKKGYEVTFTAPCLLDYLGTLTYKA